MLPRGPQRVVRRARRYSRAPRGGREGVSCHDAPELGARALNRARAANERRVNRVKEK
jgi:hypothetical protein